MGFRGNSGVAKLWDLATGEELYTLPNLVSTVIGVKFNADGDWLVTVADGGRLYDVQTGVELLTFTQNGVRHLALNSDGSRL